MMENDISSTELTYILSNYFNCDGTFKTYSYKKKNKDIKNIVDVPVKSSLNSRSYSNKGPGKTNVPLGSFGFLSISAPKNQPKDILEIVLKDLRDNDRLVDLSYFGNSERLRKILKGEVYPNELDLLKICVGYNLNISDSCRIIYDKFPNYCSFSDYYNPNNIFDIVLFPYLNKKITKEDIDNFINACNKKASRNFENFTKLEYDKICFENQNNFRNTLKNLIQEKNISQRKIDYDAYGGNSNFNKKITGKRDFEKNDALKMCIVLKLNKKESNNLMSFFGGFDKSDIKDVIVEYAVNNEKYDKKFINDNLKIYFDRSEGYYIQSRFRPLFPIRVD